jgi:hypothetical protein
MQRHEFHVRFDSLSTAEANQAAADLRQAIRRAGGGEVSVELMKESAETQDFGTVLAVILGTKAAIAVAQGIGDFIAKWGNQIVIETPEGRMIARGDAANNIDVAQVAAAFKSGAAVQ